MVANAASTAETVFVAITPCRLLDTRSDVDPIATSKVENLGIRKGKITSKTEGNKGSNDIVVIFDKDATDNTSDHFTLLYGNTDKRPILGACDDEFDLVDSEGDQGDLYNAEPAALLLNVTTVGSTANGFVTVYPWQTLLDSSSNPATGTNITNRPFYSNLNPISTLPSVSNNVTVMLETMTGANYLPSVLCTTGSHSSDPEGDGTFIGSNCTSLDAFRVYNENGNTHVIIDVLGYYTV